MATYVTIYDSFFPSRGLFPKGPVSSNRWPDVFCTLYVEMNNATLKRRLGSLPAFSPGFPEPEGKEAGGIRMG